MLHFRNTYLENCALVHETLKSRDQDETIEDTGRDEARPRHLKITSRDRDIRLENTSLSSRDGTTLQGPKGE